MTNKKLNDVSIPIKIKARNIIRSGYSTGFEYVFTYEFDVFIDGKKIKHIKNDKNIKNIKDIKKRIKNQIINIF